ncbi:hypothetical protein ABT354_08965 [Streptomyces sp. NPDC000594]|uniref:hypothetical protein n=1 Tax=Streptomyces sp. NPDC000594 TaxID=3154261 RepID=UPI00331F24ED
MSLYELQALEHPPMEPSGAGPDEAAYPIGMSVYCLLGGLARPSAEREDGGTG